MTPTPAPTRAAAPGPIPAPPRRPVMSLSHHRPARRPRPAAPRRDHGYVLAKFAILLVPLLLMTGLSVDVGYWYNRAADIQKAADAAALAGVVWLPDIETARDHARVAAAKNGFVDGVDGIHLTIEPAGDRRLRVAIRDDSVGSFFFLSLGGRTIDMTREGLAEYVLPVPLGSPYNFFGMGGLTSNVPGSPLASPTVIYQSVNPSCTSKVNGDRHQSLHFNPQKPDDSGELSSCASAPTNDDYRTLGYELYI
ncbi:MAG TPA: pilus assembly protein TadG-related protein, partial [Iamia sp.]|nr:pilus assembly protein TadG-related protein [Iamia sp.]